jgi:hypothetical protein
VISEPPQNNTSSAQAVIPPEEATRPPPQPADEALFRKLVHDHQQRLYRFIVKHIGWGTDAEELTQQAFVEAAHSYATFKGNSELSTWLYDLPVLSYQELTQDVNIQPLARIDL